MPIAKKKAGRRGRKPLVVVPSKQTEAAAVRLARADEKLETARSALRDKVGVARKLAGTGRGRRPAQPKAAERAKAAVAKAQDAFGTARIAARDARKVHRLAVLQDRERAQIAQIGTRLEAVNAAGAAKALAKVEQAVAKLRRSLEGRVLKLEARRAVKRTKVAERKIAMAERRLQRQFAKASGQKVRRQRRAKSN